MNFDDDLLGDILSEGSNDSFFEDPKITRKSSVQKPSELTNILNNELKLETKPETSKTDWLGLNKAPKEKDNPANVKVNSPIKTKRPLKKISFEDDDDDILGTLGLKKTPEKSSIEDVSKVGAREIKTGRKSDFLESILKPPKIDTDNFNDILPKKEDKNESSSITTKQSSLPSFGNIEGAREGRRRRSGTGATGLMDPLGLFSSGKGDADNKKKSDELKPPPTASITDIKSAEVPNVFQESRSVPNILESTNLPDWLGGSSVKTKSDQEWTSTTSTKSKSETVVSDKTENPVEEAKPTKSIKPEDGLEHTNLSQYQIFNSVMAHQKMAQSQLEYQNTAISLQQQESQILMALQLKKYEDNLQEIQRQQQEVLVKQEQQFNELLERQFAKQHALENNMRLQQERINSHIQLLLSQPTVKTPVSANEEAVQKAKNDAEEEHIKLYEHMIANLKQRQQEELFLLEESYKKQITMLEESMNNTETRLKTELEAVLSKSEKNLKLNEEKHAKEIDKYKQKIQLIEEEHVADIKQMRDNHLRVIEELKFEHNLMLENIKDNKKAESSLFSDAKKLGEKFEMGMDILITNSALLQNVSSKVGKDQDGLFFAREESIKAKEKEIEMIKISLEKCRESAEIERAQLLSVVRNLELKLVDQNQNAREERWALQQAVSTLTARAAAFDREMEYSRASIEREREELKTLKESMLSEQERLIAHLTEEKLTISAERSRLETASKLNLNFDTQKAKVEIDAALKVAQEAAAMTDREREILQRQQVELETLRRTLQDKERKLNTKELELAKLAKIAEDQLKEGERSMDEAKLIESRYNERMKNIQFQLVQLSSREKKLTEEKIVLSQERLALNTAMRQNKQCSLCFNDPSKLEEKHDWNSENRNSRQIFSRFNEINEADIFRLQFEDDVTVEQNLKSTAN